MTLLSLCLCLGGNDWSTLESVWRTSFLWVNHKECDQTLQDLFGVKKVVVYILLCHVQKNYFSCFRREMRRKRRSRWRRKIPKRVKIWGGDQPETGKTSATGGCGQGGGVKGSEGIPGSGVQGPGSRDRGPGSGVQGAGSRERGPGSRDEPEAALDTVFSSLTHSQCPRRRQRSLSFIHILHILDSSSAQNKIYILSVFITHLNRF